MIPNKESLELLQQDMSSSDNVEFEDYFAKYGDLVFRRCYSLLGNYDEASDAAQLIWTKVYFALPGFRGDSSFKSWLYRIVYNQCISIMRRRYKHIPLDDDIDIDPSIAKESLSKQIQTKLDTEQLLEVISHEDRALIYMKYVDNFKFADIAGTLGIKEGACKMRVARIKQKLKDEYEKKN